MASAATLAKCSQCESLRSALERATACRLQAESDYISAIYSRNPTAVEGATHTANRTLRNGQRRRLRYAGTSEAMTAPVMK